MDCDRTMKKEYLVVYDYETGGAWAFLTANSAEEILERLPELKIVTVKPTWLTPTEEEHIRRSMSIDIDDVDHPFLQALIQSRA